MRLSNNKELYEYLVTLSALLRKRGSSAMNDLILSASKKAAGMSTEFLGESRIALRQLRQKEIGILDEQERTELIDVLMQLDAALDKR